MRAGPRSVLVAAWLVLVIYAFPGQMAGDSFEHLIEARTGVFTDGHPPVMDAIFVLSEKLVSGPLLILLVQATGLLVGLYLLLRRTFVPGRAAWITAALYVYPPILLTMAVAWKDSLMAAMLVLGAAGLLVEDRRWRLAALGALFGATLVRYNAFAATFPLVVLLFRWRSVSWWKRYALAFAAWLTITGAAFVVNAALTDQKMYYWHSSLAAHDIAGTLAHVDGDLSDAELEDLFAGSQLRVHADIHAHIRRVYSPKNFFNLVQGDDALWTLPYYGSRPAPPEQRDAIERAWKETLTAHPGAYLRHRLAVTSEVLSLQRGHPPTAVLARDLEYPDGALALGISPRASPVQRGMTAAMKQLSTSTPLFEPWMYLAIAILVLAACRKHRDVFALLLSGIGLESSLVFLAPTPDYRYSHWMITATCIAVVVLVARRSRTTARRGALA